LREATVFFTVLGDDKAREDTLIALNSARGVIRSEMGKRLGMKHTPSLTFIPDALPETAEHINELLREAAAADAQVHAQSVGARFAGDADPYKHPHDEDEEDK
jgi:ribosome-binding factor A